MDDFKIYLPLEKGAFPSGSYEKIVETNSTGEPRTRFKIKGIASTTSLDRDNEIVSKICLKSMETQINQKKLPIFGNHNHDWENMLGYTNVAIHKDNKLEIDILTDYVETNPKVLQMIGKVEGGMPLALSIGGKVVKSRPNKNKEGVESKILDDVNLFETSIVGIGANQDAFLSLPDQITKSMEKKIDLKNKIRAVLKEVKENDKEELYLSDEQINKIVDIVEKNSGQLGMMDYGKLGETTLASNCPKCGKPADLRMVDNKSSHYQCSICDLHFDVKIPVKTMIANPINNPVNSPFETIDSQRQSVPGLKSANQEKKGDLMDIKKDESESEVETEEEVTEEVTETQKGCGKAEEEEEYSKFVKFAKRAMKEGVFKAEGISTTPGGENAAPKNTIGGSGGAAAPVHQKSIQYESVKKAFVEEAGAEAFSTAKVEKKVESFADVRKMFAKRGV